MPTLIRTFTLINTQPAQAIALLLPTVASISSMTLNVGRLEGWLQIHESPPSPGDPPVFSVRITEDGQIINLGDQASSYPAAGLVLAWSSAPFVYRPINETLPVLENRKLGVTVVANDLPEPQFTPATPTPLVGRVTRIPSGDSKAPIDGTTLCRLSVSAPGAAGTTYLQIWSAGNELLYSVQTAAYFELDLSAGYNGLGAAGGEFRHSSTPASFTPETAFEILISYLSTT